MRVLLDENLPQDLRHHFGEHEAVTVGYLGWTGTRNSELLMRAAAHGFKALITGDSGIPDQQNTGTLPVTVIVLRAASNSLEAFLPLMPAVQRALRDVPARSVVVIGP